MAVSTGRLFRYIRKRILHSFNTPTTTAGITTAMMITMVFDGTSGDGDGAFDKDVAVDAIDVDGVVVDSDCVFDEAVEADATDDSVLANQHRTHPSSFA